MPISTRKAGAPDGIYGKETHGAVYKFQTDQKLGKDGVAGRQTIQRLDTILASRKKPTPVRPAPPPPPAPTPIAPRPDSHYTLGTADPKLRHDPGAGAWNRKSTELTYIALKQTIVDKLPYTIVITGPNAVRPCINTSATAGRRSTSISRT
jgi:peptidoglycan hydrolase-like protein with peptidoglycan-binding domain